MRCSPFSIPCLRPEMRVWIQNPFDNLPEEGYRKQRYRLLAEAFRAHGEETVLWTSFFSHANKKPRKLIAPLPEWVRIIEAPRYTKNLSLKRVFSHLVYAVKWYRSAVREGLVARPDIIVSSIPTISGAVAAIRLGRKFRAQVVIDLQDAWPETFERVLPRWLLSPLRLVARWVYRHADAVTGVCERYRSLTGREDFYRAYHGMEFEPVERKTPPGNRRYVYAGALGRSYDLSSWIDKVEKDPDLTLDIAANQPIKTSCERIRQHGYLEREKLMKLLASCDVGIIPMSADSWVGLPYKLCDYVQARLKIETTLGGECADFVERWNAAIERGEDLAELLWQLDARQIYPRYVAHILRSARK